MQHNFTPYGGLPIWTAIEIFDFGAMSKLSAGIRDGDRDYIAKSLGINGAEIASRLRTLNFIRNQAAHHARFRNCDMLEKVKISATLPSWDGYAHDRPFLYFSIIQFILKR